jgi:hypothetical protein
VYKANLARFLADNKRQPDAAEKQDLVGKAIKAAKEDAKLPEDAPMDLSPAAIDIAARRYLQDGTLPTGSLGGKASANLKARVMNRAAEIDPAANIAANKGTNTANQASLVQLTKTANATEAFAKTATDNLDLALAQSGQVARTGSKLANRYLQWVQGELTPAEGLTQFETYIYTAAREYAKVTSGGAMTSPWPSDNERRTDSPRSPASRSDHHRELLVAVVTKADDDLPIDRLPIDPRGRLEHGRHIVDPAFRIVHLDVPGRRFAFSDYAVANRVVDLRHTQRPQHDRPDCGCHQWGSEHQQVGPAGQHGSDREQQTADQCAGVRSRRPPAVLRRHDEVVPPGVGVGTEASTSSVTVVPEALVSHSSGLIVIR